MRKLCEWDCGYWDRGSRFGRVTVRENPHGFYEIYVVSYARPGLTKREELIDVALELAEARRRGWELHQSLDR